MARSRSALLALGCKTDAYLCGDALQWHQPAISWRRALQRSHRRCCTHRGLIDVEGLAKGLACLPKACVARVSHVTDNQTPHSRCGELIGGVPVHQSPRRAGSTLFRMVCLPPLSTSPLWAGSHSTNASTQVLAAVVCRGLQPQGVSMGTLGCSWCFVGIFQEAGEGRFSCSEAACAAHGILPGVDLVFSALVPPQGLLVYRFRAELHL